MIFPIATIIVGTFLFAFYAWRFNARMSGYAQSVESNSGVIGSEIAIRKAVPAHAARARKLVEDTDSKFTVALPAHIQDIFSHEVDTTGKHLGIVSGSSCTRYGFKDGDLFLGDVIGEDEVLNEGDFVVVDAKADGSNVRQRIRRIRKVGELIEFNDDDKGHPHRARERKEIIARITHILA